MRPIAIVPAAGRGERFGGPKLDADIAGEPMLARVVRVLFEGGVQEAVVVAGAHSIVPSSLTTDPRVRVIVNPDPDRGMFSSIQAGVAAAAGDPLLILPGDMPFVQPRTVRRVIETFSRHQMIVSPRVGGRRGHPLALPASLRLAVLGAVPGTTLADLLRAHEAERLAVDVDDPGVLRDVDVREDL